MERTLESAIRADEEVQVIRHNRFDVYAIKLSVESASDEQFEQRRIEIPEGMDPDKIAAGIIAVRSGANYVMPATITSDNTRHYAIFNRLSECPYVIVRRSDDDCSHSY